MVDISEDFLNEDNDLDLDVELDEEALLLDDEEDTDQYRQNISNTESHEDVELEIESEELDDTADDSKLNTSEIEDSDKRERTEKFTSERKLITPPENIPVESGNYVRRKPFQRNNFRGMQRGRGRGYHNNLIRRNKTVLINPNFQGIVHVNNSSARLQPSPWATAPQHPPQLNNMHMPPRQQQLPVQCNMVVPLYQNPQHFSCPPPQPQPQNVSMPYWDGQNQLSYPSCDQFQFQPPPQQPFINMQSGDRQVFANPPSGPNFNVPPPMQIPQNQMMFENNSYPPNPNQYPLQNNHFYNNNNFPNQSPNPFMTPNNNNFQRPPQGPPQDVKRSFLKPQQQFVPRKKPKFVNNNGRSNLIQPGLMKPKLVKDRLGVKVEINIENPMERPQVITQVKVEDPDEDDDTKNLRLQIELQKKKREEILRWKEERRKKVLQENQVESGAATPATIVSENRKQFTTPQSIVPKKNTMVTPNIPLQNKQIIRQPPQNRSNVLMPKLQLKHKSPNIVVTNGYSKRLSKYQKGAPNINVNANNRIVTVPAPAEKSNTNAHLSNFLADRKVLVKDNSLINTRQVMIKNLSTSTPNKRIMTICKTIGEVEKLQRNKLKQQATISFKSVASAHAFYKKYQRHMIDLSMIEVTLVPKAEPAE